jgi:hypothetical protein
MGFLLRLQIPDVLVDFMIRNSTQVLRCIYRFLLISLSCYPPSIIISINSSNISSCYITTRIITKIITVWVLPGSAAYLHVAIKPLAPRVCWDRTLNCSPPSKGNFFFAIILLLVWHKNPVHRVLPNNIRDRSSIPVNRGQSGQ